MASSLRFLWRPIQGTVIWGGTGLGAGVALPPLLSNFGWIYSTSLITTTACGGAIAILLPLGMARGIVSSLQLYLIEEGNISKAVEQVSSTPIQKLVTMENPKLMWETMTFGSGWKGKMIRTIASPFLPSTTQMLMRMQQSVDANQTDSNKVLASAASGLVEGFLQDRKDTITMFGLLGYAAVVGIGLGVDYSYRRIDEKKAAIKDSAREKKEAAEKMVQDKKQQFKDVTDKFKVWKKSPSSDNDEDNNEKSSSNVTKETSETFVETNKHYIEDVSDGAREKKDEMESKFQDMKQDLKDVVGEKLDENKQQQEDSSFDKAKKLAEDAVQESKMAAEKVFSEEKRQQWKDAASSWLKKKKKNEMEEKRHESTAGNDENNNEKNDQ